MSDQNTDNSTGYNLFDIEADFRTYLLAVIRLKPVSVKNYISDFTYFAGWIQKVADRYAISGAPSKAEYVQQLNSQIISEYRKYLMNAALPQRTINRRLSSLRKFFSYAIDQGWIEENPAKSVRNVRKGARHVHNSFSYHEEPAETSVQPHHPDVLLSSFRSDLVAEGSRKKDVSVVLSDVQEFFTIINSYS